MAEKKDLIQEVNELVEMLMALAPTSNRISQFVLMSVERVRWNHDDATFYTSPSRREEIDRLMKL